MPIRKITICQNNVEKLLKYVDDIKICPGYVGIWSKSCEKTLEGKSIKCKCFCQLQYNDKKKNKEIVYASK